MSLLLHQSQLQRLVRLVQDLPPAAAAASPPEPEPDLVTCSPAYTVSPTGKGPWVGEADDIPSIALLNRGSALGEHSAGAGTATPLCRSGRPLTFMPFSNFPLTTLTNATCVSGGLEFLAKGADSSTRQQQQHKTAAAAAAAAGQVLSMAVVTIRAGVVHLFPLATSSAIVFSGICP